MSLMLLFVGFVFTARVTLPVGARLAEPELYVAASRTCTVDELIPHSTLRNTSISPEWSDKNTVEALYGCDCSFTRARYGMGHIALEISISYICMCMSMSNIPPRK